MKNKSIFLLTVTTFLTFQFSSAKAEFTASSQAPSQKNPSFKSHIPEGNAFLVEQQDTSWKWDHPSYKSHIPEGNAFFIETEENAAFNNNQRYLQELENLQFKEATLQKELGVIQQQIHNLQIKRNTAPSQSQTSTPNSLPENIFLPGEDIPLQESRNYPSSFLIPAEEDGDFDYSALQGATPSPQAGSFLIPADEDDHVTTMNKNQKANSPFKNKKVRFKARRTNNVKTPR